MKRSEVNSRLRDADAFIRARGFLLPPFAYWTPQDWQRRHVEAREIMANGLGWDITDFGSGAFEKIGLFLFTLRNGSLLNWERKQGKLYAEKILVVEPGQVTPLHFHWRKVEDIINRGGGDLELQLYNSTADEALAASDVTVSVDALPRTVRAGGTITLTPGESITLPTRLYHQFWGVRQRVLVGEVSLVNDDAHDNRFFEPVGRFPEIEEDEPPLRLLVGDYARL